MIRKKVDNWPEDELARNHAENVKKFENSREWEKYRKSFGDRPCKNKEIALSMAKIYGNDSEE